jgi:hypothetical protein
VGGSLGDRVVHGTGDESTTAMNGYDGAVVGATAGGGAWAQRMCL